MFGEDESESPRQPSPWQAVSPPLSTTPTSLTVPPTSSFTRRASYLERMAIEACAQSVSQLSLTGVGTGGGGALGAGIGTGSTPLSRVSSQRALAMSLEAEAIRMEGQLWAGEMLAPEVDEIGHIEYKLKLVAPNAARRAKLTTQLQWRLLEGGGTALYEIGVLDDGTLVGLSRTEMVESLATLDGMAAEIGAVATVNRVVELPEIIVRAGPVQDGTTVPSPASTPVRVGSSSSNVGRKKKIKNKRPPRSSGSTDPHLRPPSGKAAKLRIQPGDAAVSSSSSGSEDDGSTSAGERGSSTDASATRSAETSFDTSFPDLPSPIPTETSPPAPPPTLSPMEKAAIRRRKRDENRATREMMRIGTDLDADISSADSSRPASALDVVPVPVAAPAPEPAVEVKPPEEAPAEVKEDAGPRFVIEVLVRQDRDEGQAFLDFEGFGLEE